MKIIVIVGMPASGKNIAHTYAETKGIPYFATGDLVRQEVRKRDLSPSAENMAFVSTELRGEDGMGVTRMALQTALDIKEPLVFLEGMRSWPEIKLIKDEADATVVAFLAPRASRLERITARGRSDDSPDAFEARDQREIEYGAAVPLALGDEYILNTGTLQDAFRDLEAIIERRCPISG